MTSMQLLLALVPSVLAWFQLYPPQSIVCGTNHSALAQNQNASPLSGAASRFLPPQRPEEPRRKFLVFDAMLFKQKPDLTRYGLSPISMVYEGTIWQRGHSDAVLPDRDLVRSTAVEASKSGGIAVLDIERWPLSGDATVVEESIRRYETVIRWFKEAAP